MHAIRQKRSPMHTNYSWVKGISFLLLIFEGRGGGKQSVTWAEALMGAGSSLIQYAPEPRFPLPVDRRHVDPCA